MLLLEIFAEIGIRDVIIHHPNAGQRRETVVADTGGPAVLRLA